MYLRNSSYFFQEHDPTQKSVINWRDSTPRKFRIEFYPGGDTGAYQAARTEVAFPQFAIDEKISISANFDESQPRGMQLASSMKLKIDLTQFKDDFVDVKNWILQGQNQTEISPAVYGDGTNPKSVFLPNVWVMKMLVGAWVSAGGSWVTWAESWQTIFIGYQIPTASPKVSLKKNGTKTFELTVNELSQWVGEKFDFDANYTNLILGQAGTNSETVVRRYIDLEYYQDTNWDGRFWYRQLSTAANNHKYVFMDFDNFFNNYITTYNRYLNYWNLGSEALGFISTGFFRYWKFYKQADYTQNYPMTELGTYTPKFLAYVVDTANNQITGGFFHKSEIIERYKTAWDFIKVLANNWCIKINLDYKNKQFVFNPLLDSNSSIDFKTTDIRSEDIDIELNYKVAGTGVAHLNDDLEYKWNRFGNLYTTTDEGEFYHTTCPAVLTNMKKGVTIGGTLHGLECKWLLEARLSSPSYEGLYFPQARDDVAGEYEMVRVYPTAKLYLNEAKTYTHIDNTNTYTLPDFWSRTKNEKDDNFVEKGKIWRDQCLSVSSSSRAIWGHIASNSNINQALVEITTEKIFINDLHKKVNFENLGILELDWLSPKNPKVFITDIEYDDLNKIAGKVKFFITADGF